MAIVYLFILVTCAALNNAARILTVIPTPSISHQVVFRPWTLELIKRGHEVVVITTDPIFPKGEAPPNLKEIDVHDLSYKTLHMGFMDTSRGNKDDLLGQFELLLDLFTDVISQQFNTSDVQEIIHNKSFDLLILEACSRPLLALSHVIKAPVILGSSFGAISINLEAIGAPLHPLLYPSIIQKRLYNVTLWEKIKELFHFYKCVKMVEKHEEIENKMVQKYFGADVPPLSVLQNNVDMLFLNTHPIFEGNHPVPPGVVYMWGIHRKPQNELPKELKNYLDNSKHGVIYMSFGSNVIPSKLPPKTISTFIKVFCELPYDVLFKWDQDELPGRCKNVRFGKWFPQADLLRHPKVKLFVTQGGLQSTDEAISAQVPLVGIPMLADQWYNVEKYVHFKIGLHLELESINEETFRKSVKTVIEDKSYRENVKRLDEVMRDEPTPALERVVWWTEHVLRHGGARHLRAPAANMSWPRYYEIQLVAVILGVILTLLAVLLMAVYYLLKLLSLLKRKSKVE